MWLLITIKFIFQETFENTFGRKKKHKIPDSLLEHIRGEGPVLGICPLTILVSDYVELTCSLKFSMQMSLCSLQAFSAPESTCLFLDDVRFQKQEMKSKKKPTKF